MQIRDAKTPETSFIDPNLAIGTFFHLKIGRRMPIANYRSGTEMSRFEITFVPPLGPVEPRPVPENLRERLNVPFVQHVQASYSHEHLVQYVVNGELFAYYPTSILTLLNDLNLELTLLRGRENHEVTLSGYTVLRLEFHGDVAQLFDPARRDDDRPEESLGEYEVAELESKFQSAAATVWGLILSLR